MKQRQRKTTRDNAQCPRTDGPEFSHAPQRATFAHADSSNHLNRQRGLLLPVLAILIAALVSPLAALYLQRSDESNHPMSRTRAIQREHLLMNAQSAVLALAAVKGFSRPEELGALTCPDADGDGVPDFCGSDARTQVTGGLPDRVRVGPGLLLLAPSAGSLPHRALNLSIDPRTADGSDQTRAPATDTQAMLIRTAWDEDTRMEHTKSEQSRLAQSRLKAAFLAHLNLAARNQNDTLSARWAFQETLHLAHEADSAGTRFKPVNSGCQCSCTKTRCKCACLQTSVWETRGGCISASDSGTCSTLTGLQGRVTRCTAAPGRYCYLDNESGLASRWPVSLYTPRATEGRACRPERNDTCSLTSKTGSTCTCAFDWPKPINQERLDRLNLLFSTSGGTIKATAGLAP